MTGPGQSTTAATPAGNCWQCGGQLYENLFHSCTTSVAGAFAGGRVNRPEDTVREAGALQNNVIVAATAMYERIRTLEAERDRLCAELAEHRARAGGGS